MTIQGGERSLIGPDDLDALAEVLPSLAELLLTREPGPDDTDIAVAEQLVGLSEMLGKVAAAGRKTEGWLAVWAAFAKASGLDTTINPDVAEFDPALARDLMAAAKATVEWHEDPVYRFTKGGA